MREREVLQLTAEAISARIGERWAFHQKLSKLSQSRLMGKLGVRDLPELVRFAIKHGITP